MCRICNSEEHFAANCPQNRGGKGGGGPLGPPALLAQSGQASGSQQAEGDGVLWAPPTQAALAWAVWQPDLTSPGDGWGTHQSADAYPGFQVDEGASSDDTSSMTSSDSGNEVIDMSDLYPLDDQQAAEHVFWQYRTFKRKWRRFTGNP